MRSPHNMTLPVSDLERICQFVLREELITYTVVEGTGHCGVGSIVNLDNARVASILGLSMVIVVNGGLGSAFDDLAINRLSCIHHGVKLKGVIVNKVVPDKVDMITDYFGRALKRWEVPLLGVVPDATYLSQPSMLDFQDLFKTKVLAGEQDLLRHYDSITLVSVSCSPFPFIRLHFELT